MKHSRRDFLRHSIYASAGAAVMSGALFDLQRIAAATSSSSIVDDYKALVCIFLEGGNDSLNMVVPRDTAEYAFYAEKRRTLALAKNSLLPLNATDGNGHSYGLHPNMGGLQNLFNNGKAAYIAGVGPLVVPITRAEFEAGSKPLPRNLLSHSDQATLWQANAADNPSAGWGGLIADMMHDFNNPRISSSISTTYASLFNAGSQTKCLTISPGGVNKISEYDDNPQTTHTPSIALNKNIGDALTSNNIFEAEYARTLRGAIDNGRLISDVLAGAQTINTPFPNTWLGQQLKMVARLISAQTALGLRRQVFYCSIGGYDTHSEQLDSHAGSVSELSNAMAAFYSATTELGVAQNVTTFTASDFGRNLRMNDGNGTDHGWGGGQFVMGGAVRGNNFYGNFPEFVENGPNHTNWGVEIPRIAVDQMGAKLAEWFGVSSSNIPLIFPNIGRFSSSNLDFMLNSNVKQAVQKAVRLSRQR